MALFGQISAGAGDLGAAINLADSLFQNQVRIKNVLRPGQQNFVQDEVYINVTDNEDMTLSVNITEHPISNLGSVVDYVSRNSTPFVLTGVISNRNLNLKQDPSGFIGAHGAAFAPEIFGAVAAGVSAASKFFDLGQDEITRKLQVMNRWMNNAEIVELKGVKIDATKIVEQGETFNYLINNIHPVHNPDTGDCVAVDISFINIRYLQNVQGTKQGVTVVDRILGVLKSTFVNPFI